MRPVEQLVGILGHGSSRLGLVGLELVGIGFELLRTQRAREPARLRRARRRGAEILGRIHRIGGWQRSGHDRNGHGGNGHGGNGLHHDCWQRDGNRHDLLDGHRLRQRGGGRPARESVGSTGDRHG
jgi:hypothetical protein